jgi:hypothetical protein
MPEFKGMVNSVLPWLGRKLARAEQVSTAAMAATPLNRWNMVKRGPGTLGNLYRAEWPIFDTIA